MKVTMKIATNYATFIIRCIKTRKGHYLVDREQLASWAIFEFYKKGMLKERGPPFAPIR